MGNSTKTAVVLLAIVSVACAQEIIQPGHGGNSKLHAGVPSPSRSGAAAPVRINAARAMQYLREVVAFGSRPAGSEAHKKLEAYLRSRLNSDNLEVDNFIATTPAGKVPMTNLIAKFPGTGDGIIVIAGHYDTAGTVPNFVGANDGGSSTAVMLELANQLRTKKRQGHSVWLVWLDGEEAMRQWSDADGLYGSRHLAGKWQNEGTAKKIKACFVADMIGDADLNIERDQNSTPRLEELVFHAATNLGYQSHFFRRTVSMVDDHTPFIAVGIPAAELIDYEYGYANAYWHTPEDKIDKLSPKSLEIVGKVLLETVRLLDAGG